jgi:hypothetical protein
LPAAGRRRTLAGATPDHSGASSMTAYRNVLEMIGNTPMMEVR